MRLSLICLLFAAGLFAACKDGGKPASTDTTASAAKPEQHNPQSDLSDDQTAKLMNLVTAYYSLKDALVASDGAKADGAASKLLSEAELFRNDIGNQPQAAQIKPHLEELMRGCEAITGQKGMEVEIDRKHFAALSDAMFKVMKEAHLRHGGVYQQFCPMAMNDKGAYWLSPESEIKNPYLPKTMLECGEVRDSL